MLTDGVIRLVTVSAAHLDGLAGLLEDPEVVRNTRVPEPWEQGFEHRWLKAYEDGQKDGSRDGFAIEDADTGAFLGIAGLVGIERDANQAEIGYVVVREARGRGIATRALRLVTDYALGEVGLDRVQLLINVDNEPSLRVAERCGYSREGVFRSLYLKPGRRADMAVYSRLPGDREN
ncbi:MAG TPA: GNAT family N-acetyltransferase [Gaiellaceae bacterium]|nr:GNAT family N-acetyltransferase [Gaiellaceae bacterium]